jgi:hypothetical protein
MKDTVGLALPSCSWILGNLEKRYGFEEKYD